MTRPWVVDALVAGQASGIGVVARGFLGGCAQREDVVALVPPDTADGRGRVVVRSAASRHARLLWQRTGLVVALGRRHAGRGATFVGLDAFSLPAVLPAHSRVLLHDVLPFTHGQYWTSANRWHKRASVRSALRSGAQVFVASSHNARAAARLGATSVTVAPFGCGQVQDGEAQAALDAGPAAARDPTLVTVGNLQPRKRLEVLLQAFADARAGTEDHTVDLVVVGSGDVAYTRHLRELADRLRVPVTWAGACTWEQTAPLLRHARAVVYPSVHEGFGLPILEAMALGTRPIAADIPAVRDWAGDWPRYVDPTRDSLTAGLVQILDGDREWDGAAAMQAVAHHRWQTFVDTMLGPGAP